jgi:hypothetical protein
MRMDAPSWRTQPVEALRKICPLGITEVRMSIREGFGSKDGPGLTGQIRSCLHNQGQIVCWVGVVLGGWGRIYLDSGFVGGKRHLSGYVHVS